MSLIQAPYVGYRAKHYFFRIVDTEFSCVAMVDFAPAAGAVPNFGGLVHAIAAIIKEYTLRDLPVVDAVIKYYKYRNRHGHYSAIPGCEFDKLLLDTYFPQLQYGRKYYDDVVKGLNA